MAIQLVRCHLQKLVGFKVHFNDLLIRNSISAQMRRHQLEQTGLSAPADTGYYFDGLGVLKCNELIQVKVSFSEGMRTDHAASLLCIIIA